MKKLLTEFIGTFLLVFTIHGVVIGNGGAIGIGIGLMALVYMGGSVSGAHYNPAVTLGLWTLKKIGTGDAVNYVLAQLLGGFVAALVGTFCFGGPLAPAPAGDIDATRALVIEIVFTFMLVLTVMNVAASKRTEGNPYFGFAIGAVVVAGALSGGSFSGGAFNPAVGIAPNLAAMLTGAGKMSTIWIYLVGPIVGGQLAALVFKIQEEAGTKG